VSFFTLALLVVSAGMSMISGVVLLKNLNNMEAGFAWVWGAVFLLASVNALWCAWSLL
jgi:hypothetical protein